MIPLKDDNPTTHPPVITISFIVINVIVFFLELSYGLNNRAMMFSYGAIPYNLVTMEDAQPIHPFLTVFTSMFMHGGFFHIIGNMLYLWIFGNNIEDRLGHIKFILFYLFCGLVAAYSHAISDTSSQIPMIGASGAVSGVLGAYIMLFPKAKIYTLIFFGFFFQIIKVPAVVVIGFWAVIQFLNGILSKGLMPAGGVAWFAHVGGFLAGLLTIKFLIKKKPRYS